MVEDDYGLLAFCLIVAAHFVAVVFLCELRAEQARPNDPKPGARRRARPRRHAKSTGGQAGLAPSPA